MPETIFKGMEGVFIPVKDVKKAAKWYEDKLDFQRLFDDGVAITLRIADNSGTVVCLVETLDHQPMHFPDNSFQVSHYYNFKPRDIEKPIKF